VDFSRLLAKCSTVVDRRPIIAPFTADVTGNSGVQERPGDYRYMLHALAVGVDGEWSVYPVHHRFVTQEAPVRQRRTSSRRPGGIANGSTRFTDFPDSYLTPLPEVAWKVSSRCAGNGACVEVAQLSMGRIALRDGMNPEKL